MRKGAQHQTKDNLEAHIDFFSPTYGISTRNRVCDRNVVCFTNVAVRVVSSVPVLLFSSLSFFLSVSVCSFVL